MVIERSATGSTVRTGVTGSHPVALFLAEGDVCRPLVAHVAAHNVGSIRVLETCGFEVSTEDSDVGEVVMVLG
jgi:hypothetical protein